MRQVFFTNNKTDIKIGEIFCRKAGVQGNSFNTIMIAVDGVYKNGRHIKEESDILITNDYVMSLSKTSKTIIFGASVHPYRQHDEMLNEVRRCIEADASFFVWMPEVQQIDPEDDRCIPFYISIAKEEIPLLCYMGAGNRTAASSVNSGRYSDPQKLIRALDIGVNVIISNYPSYNSEAPVTREESVLFEELIEMLRAAESKEWGLYIDISPYCRRDKNFYEKIEDLVKHEEVNSKYLIYGCSFPVPSSDNLGRVC